MNRTALSIFVLFTLAQGIFAQTASDLNEGTKLTFDNSTGAYTFSWWGRSGRIYFLQQSDDLLRPWNYVPIIETGADQVIQWGFTSTTDKFFLRLKYVDTPTGDPFNADFDGDGLSNWVELLQGTDPLAANITTGTVLPNDWQIKYFGTTGVDPNGIDTANGVTYLQDYLEGRTPNIAPVPDTTGGSVALQVFTPLQ